ncbi:hypothetical protein Pmani_032268 [Petrolisthes manimaculis]|uniref:FAS1 domain-containing protein n=1 Tax=Petrolisthes manimaculis TaxID=1843537 RepID=A0AAE1TR71_9EUCA|nr:hypothetical protein Pmani_032268 [Petrolisthes manimaculis]
MKRPTSGEPWTLLIPKNTGVGGVVGGGQGARGLLNHAVLGYVVNPSNPPPTPPITLAGTPLLFTTDRDGVLVNGVRVVGKEYKFSDGVVYILESPLPIVEATNNNNNKNNKNASPTQTPTQPETSTVTTTRVPPLTHRFKSSRGGGDVRRPDPNTRSSRLASRPVLQPVLGDEPLTLAEADGFQETEFPGETVAGSGSGAPFEELEGSAVPPVREDQPFLQSFLSYMEEGTADEGAEFLHHFKNANITHRFRGTGRYTALVPSDAAFYSYYPIDWGFNPFLVQNFTRDVLADHFIRGNINLADLPSLAELTTLGGKTIKFTRKRNKLLANGVEVTLESEVPLSRGRVYTINQLLFVDNDRVFELQAQYGDLETAPLLGNPWPASQFLSHLLGWTEEEPRTSHFAEYLNLTNLAYLVPGHDENLDPLKYTAFIPTDEAVRGYLYADAPDPFLLDMTLRNHLVLGHLVPGRLYNTHLTSGTTLTSLDNTTLIVTHDKDGEVLVGGARVLGKQTFLYNLGNVFLIDHILGITDQDILKTINKYPSQPFSGSIQEGEKGTIFPQVDAPEPVPAPTTLPPQRPTTTTTTRPTLPHQPLTFPPTPTTSTTTTPPPPSPTSPRIRFETRTEISISRRVNDGALEPLDNSS